MLRSPPYPAGKPVGAKSNQRLHNAERHEGVRFFGPQNPVVWPRVSFSQGMLSKFSLSP